SESRFCAKRSIVVENTCHALHEAVAVGKNVGDERPLHGELVFGTHDLLVVKGILELAGADSKRPTRRFVLGPCFFKLGHPVVAIGRPEKQIGEVRAKDVAVEAKLDAPHLKPVLGVVVAVGLCVFAIVGDVTELELKPGVKEEVAVSAATSSFT